MIGWRSKLLRTFRAAWIENLSKINIGLNRKVVVFDKYYLQHEQPCCMSLYKLEACVKLSNFIGLFAK